MQDIATEPAHTEPSRPEISEARRLANSANARLSTGPKTAEGKRRSSLNATRSRLHGQIECLPAEDLAIYQKLLDDVIAEYEPVGPTEKYYATSAAQSMWRLQHAVKLEQGIFATGHREKIDTIDSGHHEVDSSLAASQTFVERAKELALLTMYEGRIRRALEKDLASLKALQAERKAKYETAVHQAKLFTKYALSRDEDYQPGDDFKPASAWGGFVFSEDEMLKIIGREIRYKYASDFDLYRRDLQPKPDSGPEIDMAA